jgi:hypothetical protein
MAIDPALITTVRADQLPVSALTSESIIMHAIGTTLYRAEVSEIEGLLNIVSYRPYEVKWLNVTDFYVDENFESNGLGKSTGLWNGWQIMNGLNGTTNMDGAVALGYGVNYNSMREQVGENSKVLVKNNIPVLDCTLPVSDADNGGGSKDYVMATDVEASGTHQYINTVNVGSTNVAVDIMQNSIVQLFIMKLP